MIVSQLSCYHALRGSVSDMPEVTFQFGRQTIKCDRLRKTRSDNSMFRVENLSADLNYLECRPAGLIATEVLPMQIWCNVSGWRFCCRYATHRNTSKEWWSWAHSLGLNHGWLGNTPLPTSVTTLS